MRSYSVSHVVARLVTALSLLCVHVAAQAFGNRTKPSDFFWQLQQLEEVAPKGNPRIGGQNFTYCCLKAVNQSLDVDSDGNLVLLPNPVMVPEGKNASYLIEADSRGQFPCGATYNGDPNGAPVVQVNYTWLADECPGWQLSSKKNLNAWLQPLSGFLLPAIIFCLSVPRRRKLYIPRAFFAADLAGVKSYVPAFLGAIGALILVTLDTIIWLSTCFAFAGPMILSGLYEALLDNRILEFLRVKTHNNRLTLDMRCRCLMIILIGNLDLALDEPLNDQPAISQPTVLLAANSGNASDSHEPDKYNSAASDGRSSGLGVRRVESSPSRGTQLPLGHLTSAHANPQQLDTASQGRTTPVLLAHPSSVRSLPGMTDIGRQFTPVQRQGTQHLRPSPWRHMEALLYGIRLFDDENPRRDVSPRQWPKHVCQEGPHCREPGHVERPRSRNDETNRQVRKTKTRLRTMLHCQYSFGSIVGAPVIFFLGGFIFALLQSLEGLGDEDIAEGLAFGQWYMTIPHIAIVSGLLLAGNNPNILEGVFATEREPKKDDRSFLKLRFELAYPSCYKVAWQWLRGHTKKRWINKLIETYGYDHDFTGRKDQDSDIRDSDMKELRRVTTLGPLDWFLVLSLTGLLLGVPFVLAFLTAFYTPEVGLSCRSLTFTVYACLQFLQVLLWLWAYAGPPPAKLGESRHVLNFLRRRGWLDRRGFYDPTATRWLLGPPTRRSLGQAWSNARREPLRALWCALWYVLTTVFGLSAIFTALGGTLMQLMGVYTAGMTSPSPHPCDSRTFPLIATIPRHVLRYSRALDKTVRHAANANHLVQLEGDD